MNINFEVLGEVCSSSINFHKITIAKEYPKGLNGPLFGKQYKINKES